MNVATALVPVTVLLVEDNDGDARLAREALRDSKIHVRLERVRDGVEALAYLRREPPFADRSPPDLILLDLHMPRMDGLELLAELERDPRFAHLPAVILTSSEDERDVRLAQASHAKGFVTKPLDIDQLTRAVSAIEGLWLAIVGPPREEPAAP